MPYILVVSHHVNCRRLYVDNLVRRGYIAVGVASADEAENLLSKTNPYLVLLCCTPVAYERDVDLLRTTYGFAGTLVLMLEEKPDPLWVAARDVAAHLSETVDSRQLVETLRPWLPVMHAA